MAISFFAYLGSLTKYMSCGPRYTFKTGKTVGVALTDGRAEAQEILILV